MRLRIVAAGVLAALSLGAVPAVAAPIGFVVTNLASDQSDPELVNAWGLTASGSSPFWIGSNGTGKSVTYDGAGTKGGLTVSIPGNGSVTGVTFVNGGFDLSGFGGADLFLFASEDGTISGWRPALGATAENLVIADPANVYKGLDTANIGGSDYLYAANFHAGRVDVLGEAGAPLLPGQFIDPVLPAGYTPFNVQVLGGFVYVTYAIADALGQDDLAGAGNGIVDKFDLSGNFVQRVVTGGQLNSPWGLALAPVGFGDLGGALLVGNAGDGLINVYDPITGLFLGTLMDPSGNAIVIDGLWGLRFGNGGSAGSLTDLYFTAGPGGGTHGLFGMIDGPEPAAAPVPEPGTLTLLGIGLTGATGWRNRARRRRGTH